MIKSVRFDTQIFEWQRRGGISRYFSELMQGLSRQDVDVRPSKVWTANEHLSRTRVRRPPSGPLRAERVLRLLNGTRADDTDVFHSTYYDYRHFDRFQRARALRVVTVHDMIPELMPEQFTRGNPHLAKEQYVRAADLVLCVSQQTADAMLACYGQVAGRVVVTPLGVGEAFHATQSHGSAEPYVLYVGDRQGYKDFGTLLRGLATPELAQVRLVLAGGSALRRDEFEALEALGLSGRTAQTFPDDAGLARLYAGARAFVLTSLMEGFGLPVLEAMASGCPCLLADTPLMREVSGGFSTFFEPGDADDLRFQLTRLVRDGVDSPAREAALAHARRFTWQRTADVTFEAYAMDLAA